MIATEPTIDEYELEKMCKADPWHWACYNKLKVTGGTFRAENHNYLKEPMQSDSRVKVVMKATQGGFTTAAMFIVLHGMIYQIYPQGVAYYFPSREHVTRFSQSRFGPMIKDNPGTIGCWLQGRTDNVHIKIICGRTLYLLGARLSQKVEGLTKETGSIRSDPIDMFVLDEVDLMEKPVPEMARGRYGHSEIKNEIILSNPTIPGFGIHRMFLQSDKRYWTRRCVCGKWTCAIKEYEKCVHIREDRTGYIACPKCGRELKSDDGEWVADKPSSEIAGWQWSQFDSYYVDPATIIRKLEDPPEGDIGKIYNLSLGLPYIAAENRLTPKDVYDCCGNDGISLKDDGPNAMGIDVGNVLHVVIGPKLGEEKYKIIWLGDVPELNDVHDLGKRFNVKSCVIDIGPETHLVREFQKSEPYLVYGCRYQDRMKEPEKTDDSAGVITVDRTGIFDESHRIVVSRKIEFPRRTPLIDDFAWQMCNPVRLREYKDEWDNKGFYRYRSEDDDHYRSAINYFLLACRNAPVAPIVQPWEQGSGESRNEYTHAVAFGR